MGILVKPLKSSRDYIPSGFTQADIIMPGTQEAEVVTETPESTETTEPIKAKTVEDVIAKTAEAEAEPKETEAEDKEAEEDSSPQKKVKTNDATSTESSETNGTTE